MKLNEIADFSYPACICRPLWVPRWNFVRCSGVRKLDSRMALIAWWSVQSFQHNISVSQTDGWTDNISIADMPLKVAEGGHYGVLFACFLSSETAFHCLLEVFNLSSLSFRKPFFTSNHAALRNRTLFT